MPQARIQAAVEAARRRAAGTDAASHMRELQVQSMKDAHSLKGLLTAFLNCPVKILQLQGDGEISGTSDALFVIDQAYVLRYHKREWWTRLSIAAPAPLQGRYEASPVMYLELAQASLALVRGEPADLANLADFIVAHAVPHIGEMAGTDFELATDSANGSSWGQIALQVYQASVLASSGG